jgi:CubicO group peptidase (beta-lactamase class C family)
MRRLLIALTGVLLLGAASPSGQQPFTPFGIIPVLDAYLESLRQQAGIPGMSVALVRDGSIMWEKGYGYANVASRIRATPDTPYFIADLSQTFAAALLLRCVEERRLDLDEPLRRYRPEVTEQTATLRQLLSHTSVAPGAQPFVYNPERFAQLTTVMEACAPQPYRKSVAHRLLNRLAMRDSVPGTDWRDPEFIVADGLYEDTDVERYRDVLARIAQPYRVDTRGRAERSELPISGINASTGIVSTVRDLAKFDAALDDTILLEDETKLVAFSPTLVREATWSPTGLGWFVQTHRGVKVIWHFGHLPNGYSSLIIKVPERQTTLILLANSDGLSAPFQLSEGDLTRSVFATLFLRLVI